MDKISQLPQPIQHHILSFLEECEVGRTTCLSKTWRSIVQSRPVLVFDHDDFEPDPDSFEPKSDIEEIERESLLDSKRRVFVDHIEKSVQRIVGQGLSIQRFSLEARFDEPDWHEAELDRWVQQVVDAKVEDLSLVLKFSKPYRYRLSPVVFLSETLTNLLLSYCDLGKCRDVRLPNLLELSLDHVTLREDMIGEFTSGCPSLEYLYLECCRGLSSIHVSGLDRLTTIELKMKITVTRVKIVAPRLEVFNISSGSWWKVRIDLLLLACESSLRKLTLSKISMSEKELKSLVSKFLELEELILSDIDVVSIKIPNQKIDTLKLTKCKNLETDDIDAPNLQVLEYYQNKLPFYSIKSSFYPNNLIDLYANYSTDFFETCTDSLKDMFIKFRSVENMKLIVTFHGTKEVFVYEELDEKFINMSYVRKGGDPGIQSPVIEVALIATYQCMTDHLFKHGFHCENIYMISRDLESSRNFVEDCRVIS